MVIADISVIIVFSPSVLPEYFQFQCSFQNINTLFQRIVPSLFLGLGDSLLHSSFIISFILLALNLHPSYFCSFLKYEAEILNFRFSYCSALHHENETQLMKNPRPLSVKCKKFLLADIALGIKWYKRCIFALVETSMMWEFLNCSSMK